MSDRHLYKAKRTDNGEWVEGDLSYLVHDKERMYVFPPNGLDSPDHYEVDPSTLCQCTGVKDRNGRMIWENDMVRRKIFGCEVSGIVKWTDIGFAGFRLEVSNKHGSKSLYAIGRGTYDDDMSESCDDEVIGNVFDNLELLEVGE